MTTQACTVDDKGCVVLRSCGALLLFTLWPNEQSGRQVTTLKQGPYSIRDTQGIIWGTSGNMLYYSCRAAFYCRTITVDCLTVQCWQYQWGCWRCSSLKFVHGSMMNQLISFLGKVVASDASCYLYNTKKWCHPSAGTLTLWHYHVELWLTAEWHMIFQLTFSLYTLRINCTCVYQFMFFFRTNTHV